MTNLRADMRPRWGRPGAALSALIVAGALAPAAGATAPYVRKLPPLTTPWTRSVSTVAPLPAYPRPQLERSQWLSLNGRWQYERGTPGQTPPFRGALAQTILVPFPVQSPLSGIERGETRGWYRRTFDVPSEWGARHVVLNFGAVSWKATVYVNGRFAGAHRGDYGAFSLDITRLLRRRGPNHLLVGFYDPIGGADEPVGKQVRGRPGGIYHTASSGIWQTVWLEPVAARHITALDLTPELHSDRLIVAASATGGSGATVVAQALAGDHVVASASGHPGRPFALRIADPHLWSPSDPYLYGLRIRLVSGKTTVDRVSSYFGMRSISLGRVDGVTRILLNGRFVFESGALDQGYWPDGLYTPPTDAAIRFDIDAAKALGYNMLREHQKVEPDRWYYWADRLGLLVWQDMPSMPTEQHLPPTPAGKAEFTRELRAIVIQHRSDPSIVSWVPFNEGWDQFDVTKLTRVVKRLDPSALVDSDSGSANCCNAVPSPASDIRDTHLYFGPFALPGDRQASVIGEYGGVLPYPPAGHAWPGVPTSIGSPALSWPVSTVTAFLTQQYAELRQEIQTQGLSAAVFTELCSYEDELGIISYDRRWSSMPVGLVSRLNRVLIHASTRPADLRPAGPRVPPGTTGAVAVRRRPGRERRRRQRARAPVVPARWRRLDTRDRRVGTEHQGPRSVGGDVGPGDRHNELVHGLRVAQLRARRSVRDRSQRAGHRRLELLARDRDGRAGPAIVIGRGRTPTDAVARQRHVVDVRGPGGHDLPLLGMWRTGEPAIWRWPLRSCSRHLVPGHGRLQHHDAHGRRVCRRDPRGRGAHVRSPSGDGTADRRRGRSGLRTHRLVRGGDRSGSHLRSGSQPDRGVGAVPGGARPGRAPGNVKHPSRFFQNAQARVLGPLTRRPAGFLREGNRMAERQGFCQPLGRPCDGLGHFPGA